MKLLYEEIHKEEGFKTVPSRYDHHFQNRIILSIDQQEARRSGASQINDGDIPGFGHSSGAS